MCGFLWEMTSIFSIVSGLGRLRMRQGIACVRKVGAWHNTLPATHRYYFSETPWPIDIKMNNISLNEFRIFIFHCGRIAFIAFNLLDLGDLRKRITRSATLGDGYCEAAIPSLTGTTWRNNGSSTWNNGSRFEYHIPIPGAEYKSCCQ